MKPRVVELSLLPVVGLRRVFDPSRMGEISEFWNRFAGLRGSVPGRLEAACYGLSRPAADRSGLDYMPCVAVH